MTRLNWRRMGVVVLAGVALLAPLAGCKKETSNGNVSYVIKFPYCPHDQDVCQQSMGIHSVADSQIKAFVQVKTQRYPRYLRVYVALQHKHAGKWETEDDRYYHDADLPGINTTGLLSPVLEAFCQTGQWRMVGHVHTVSHSGDRQAVYFYYPGSRDHGTFEIATKPLGYKTPSVRITSCH